MLSTDEVIKKEYASGTYQLFVNFYYFVLYERERDRERACVLTGIFFYKIQL